MRNLHVATSGADDQDGTPERPLRSINRAASLARPGDTVIVHAGEYREWVRPPRGGLDDQRRITFVAADGEQVSIKGSEQVSGWRCVDGYVWSVTISNSLFGDFNPFAEEVVGDWIVYPDLEDSEPATDRALRMTKHLGDVYLNGVSFYEVESFGELLDPPRRTIAVDDWTGACQPIRDPDQTKLVWRAEVDREITTIWANFQGADPNIEVVEINVRPSVFMPVQQHVNFITVRGFELAQAASGWAPPTSSQFGLIGPNWAKGWVIEDNQIHDAKCAAVSLGKGVDTGDNLATVRGDRPGYQYQLETVFTAGRLGWDREHIGSHVVRGNTIYDCGQAGIVGNLGCVFSTIEDNHIYNIAVKREFYGYEIAGIKLHAAIDVAIEHNRIHDCTLGTWLDWQTQGTRINRNLYYSNSRDLFVEVSHGPYLVDHNILSSNASIEVFSQGGAFVHNLFGGSVSLAAVLDRATPYHLPHSTQVAGYATIHGGDDRYIGNIFLGGEIAHAYGPAVRAWQRTGFGSAGYDGHPPSLADYLSRVDAPRVGDHERFANVKQPVYIRDNAYAVGAQPYESERGANQLAGDAYCRVVEEGDQVFLLSRLPADFGKMQIEPPTAADLPPVRFVDAHFEKPDGSPVTFDHDLRGFVKKDGRTYPPGPIAGLVPGDNRTAVW